MLNKTKYISFGAVLVGLTLIYFVYLKANTTIMLVGIMVVLVGVISVMGIQAVAIFLEDKKLDIESLRKQGFTIVECPHCHKENVLEDKYCIFCSEDLGGGNE